MMWQYYSKSDFNTKAWCYVLTQFGCRDCERWITCLCCSFESDKRKAELEKRLEVLMRLILTTQQRHEYLTANSKKSDEFTIWVEKMPMQCCCYQDSAVQYLCIIVMGLRKQDVYFLLIQQGAF